MGGGSGRGLSFGATVGSGELPLEYTIESGVMPKLAEKGHRIHFVRFSDDEREDYVRTIVQTRLTRELKNVNKITLSFLGTGFMRYQVRNMIGTLIEIGEGKRKSEDIIDILNAQDRRKAGKTANPEGLYLKDVLY